MIAGKKEWWKEVLRKKYIRRPRIKSIEHDWTRKGTNIQELCKALVEIIQEKVYWIPRNGKRIKIWEDSILGSHKLESVRGMEGFHQWMQNEDLINLSDISICASSREWKVWKNLNPPMQFEEEYRVFQRNIQWKAPIHQREKD